MKKINGLEYEAYSHSMPRELWFPSIPWTKVLFIVLGGLTVMAVVGTLIVNTL